LIAWQENWGIREMAASYWNFPTRPPLPWVYDMFYFNLTLSTLWEKEILAYIFALSQRDMEPLMYEFNGFAFQCEFMYQ
jgi:hypothetical protein